MAHFAHARRHQAARARAVGRVLPYSDPKSSACLEHELAQQRQLLAGVGPRAGGEQAAEMAHTPVLVDGVRGRQAHRVAGALTHLRRRARRGKGHGRTSYSWDRATGDRATSPAQRILTWESCICAWPASQGAIRHVRCAETGLMRLLGDYVWQEASRVPARRQLSSSPGRAGRRGPARDLQDSMRARSACIEPGAPAWRRPSGARTRR